MTALLKRRLALVPLMPPLPPEDQAKLLPEDQAKLDSSLGACLRSRTVPMRSEDQPGEAKAAVAPRGIAYHLLRLTARRLVPEILFEFLAILYGASEKFAGALSIDAIGGTHESYDARREVVRTGTAKARAAGSSRLIEGGAIDVGSLPTGLRRVSARSVLAAFKSRAIDGAPSYRNPPCAGELDSPP
jgi:hypothetical protein